MKKKIGLVLLLIAVMAGAAFAQDKRPRNLVDAKIPIDNVYKYEHCTITGYSGPTNNPAANGPVFEESNNSATKGKRFPMFIMLPDKFESEPIGATVKTIQTGPGQTVEITVSTNSIIFGPSSRPRLLVIQPNSTLDLSASKSFVLKKGSILEDKDFKMARDADTLMEFYSSAADSWMATATIKAVDSLKQPGDTKEQLANKVIGAFQAQNAAFSALSSLAPIWMMPADFAVDMTKNMMKASLAYGLWYCYTGNKLTGAELKSDLFILLDNNDVQGTLKTILEKSGEALEAADTTIEIAQKIGKFLAGTKRGAAAFANLAKTNGKIASKITAQASKAADAIPVASTVIGLTNDVADMQIFANQAKYYYGLMSSPTITFNPNGGKAPVFASKTVNIGEIYGELPATARDGYTFSGWYTAASGGTKVEQGTRVTVAGGQTLYARWLGNSVTVKFNVNGGTPSPADKTVKVGDAYGALPAVSRNGYSFNGWNTAASGGTPVGPSTTVTAISTHTLYALWSNPSGVTVTFDSNGGTAPSSLSRQLSPGTAYGDLPTVSRGGYKFDGWYTAASGGNKIESSSRFDGSVTKLYAHWINQNDITVTFNSNGGGAPKPASKTVTVFFDYGALPTVTRDGYKFDGWYTAASGGTKVEGTTKVSIQSAHQLFARWTANSITVSFNANGSGVSNPSGKTVTFDSTYGTLPTVSRDGYTFSGWYTAASGGAKVEGTTKVTNKNAHSLYARWTANSITITFDSNGGNTPNPATKQATVGSAIGTLPTVTRSGYTFDGWFNAQTGGGKLSSSDKISGNYTTFYAHWTANAPAPQPPAPAPPSTITVTFDPAGGSAPKPATKQLTIGSPIGTLPTVTRSGYKFDGWYNAEGGKLKPDGSDKFSGRFTTFYARWTKQ